jgi:micrococcal nuclease
VPEVNGPASAGAGVEDGDTFLNPERDRVRLLAIDAPEVDEPFFGAARDRLAELLVGRKLSYRFGARKYDRYGRLLALVYADSLLVNRVLLEEGLARAYFFKDDFLFAELMDTLCRAQRRARAAGRGIWSLPEPRPEEYYYGNPRSLRFHRPECASIRDRDMSSYLIFETRAAVLDACYSPCRNCRP